MIPKWPSFRLVNYNLPRHIQCGTFSDCVNTFGTIFGALNTYEWFFFSRLTDGYQVLIHTEKTNVCDGIKDASPVEVLRVSTADKSFYEAWGLDGFTRGFDWNSCSPISLQVLLKPNFHQDTWLCRSWADSAIDSPFFKPIRRPRPVCWQLL